MISEKLVEITISVSGIKEKWTERDINSDCEPVRLWIDGDVPHKWRSLSNSNQTASEIKGPFSVSEWRTSITACAPLHLDNDDDGFRFLSKIPPFFSKQARG